VHHYIAVVEQHPLAVVLTLTADRSAVDLPQRELNVVDKRLHMAGRGTGGDQKHVGHNHEFGDVQQEDIGALLVVDGGSRQLGGFGGIGLGGDGQGLRGGVGVGIVEPG